MIDPYGLKITDVANDRWRVRTEAMPGAPRRHQERPSTPSPYWDYANIRLSPHPENASFNTALPEAHQPRSRARFRTDPEKGSNYALSLGYRANSHQSIYAVLRFQIRGGRASLCGLAVAVHLGLAGTTHSFNYCKRAHPGIHELPSASRRLKQRVQ